MEVLKKFFSKEINILGNTKPRYIWFLVWIFSVCIIGILFIFAAKIISSFHADVINMLTFGISGIVFILFLIILQNKLIGYILITLSFSSVAFIVEKFFLNNEIFSPFTTRTTIIFWVSFSTLFASLFYQNISKWILLFFPPILIIGFFTSFLFVLIMLPFIGIGILPYTPLMASIAFIVMCYKVFLELRENKYYLQYTFSKYITYTVLIFSSIYFIWFHSEWNRGQTIIRNHFLENKIINSKRSLIDDDLPAWASLGMKLPVNHVSKLYLQPESNRNGMRFDLFGSDKLFDPFSFVVSNISKKADLPNEDREQLLKLLFGYTHISLDRLWNGNSLLTTDVETHLQFFPESRVVYTEMKFSVYNEASSGQQEAIYTFKLPEGSVCTNFTLWINGREETSRLTFISQAKTAYNAIVGTESNPSYVTWMEDNLLRVRISTVMSKNYRTFKMSFTSPLAVKKDKLYYSGFKMEGPIFDSANHKIKSEIYDSKDKNLFGSGYTFEKKVSHKLNQGISEWFAYGKYKEGWGVYLDNLQAVSGEYQFANIKMKLSPQKLIEKDFIPQKIYILINSSLSKKEWKNIFSQLFDLGIDSQIILVTNEWFYSKNKWENIDFIDSQILPKFNLFPFYKISNDSEILIITNAEDSSIPFGELKGSIFYNKNKEFFGKNNKSIYVQSWNGKLSTYFNSLKEFDLIQHLNISFNAITQNLKSKKILLPEQGDNTYSFTESQVMVDTQKQSDITLKPENNLIAKLILYKKIMHNLGKRFDLKSKDSDEASLYEIVAQGNIVTPITSLIVLETEQDYNQFGIYKRSTETIGSIGKNENASNIKHGNVPESENWVIFIICIFILYFWKKIKFSRV